MRSLVLIGHGSHHHADSAAATQQAAEALRGRGPFDEVIASYWQQEPSLRQVLRTVASSDVTVIPMFLAEGYVTETVLPRELGLGFQGPVPEGGVARILGGRRVRFTRPYGTHAAMPEVILARVQEAVSTDAEAQTVVVLVGQAVPGRADSREPRRGTLNDHAEALRQKGLFAEVRTLFLDDAEQLGRWRENLTAAHIVVVPFFGNDSLVRHHNLPEKLGLLASPTAGEHVQITPPVGTHPKVAEVVLALAEEGRESNDGGDLDQLYAEAWSSLFAHARRELRLGEVLIRPTSGVYEIRHALDEGRTASELQTVVTPEGLRDLTTHDAAGHYRPVRAWRTLPRGWRAVLSEEDLSLGLRLLYPAVVEESYAHQQHNLHCIPWASTARRQTGSFAKVQRATQQQVDDTVRRVCAACLKTPLWHDQTLGQTFLDGVPGGIPCAEACTYIVKTIRDEVAQTSSQ